MQSRRHLLYIKPWEEKRFKEHRAKVVGALPAVDARAPPPREHVARKLKAAQRETERLARVQRDNFALLRRLQAVMRTARLDNRWRPPQPQPTSDRRVGVLSPAPARCAAPQPDRAEPALYSGKCYACHCQRGKESPATLRSNAGLAGDKDDHYLPALPL